MYLYLTGEPVFSLLITENCTHEHNSQILDEETINEYLSQIHPDWYYEHVTQTLVRSFDFDDLQTSMGFAQSVSNLCHKERHSANFVVSNAGCMIHFQPLYSDFIGKNDFILAAKTDLLYEW